MEVFTRCEIYFFCWSRSLGHPVVVYIYVVVNNCCWQLVKQVQMKVLWSSWTSHLIEPPWINDQGKEVQTTLYDRFNSSFVGRKGGRQFLPRKPTHPRREVVRNFGSEAPCKGKCREAKRRGWVTLIYCSDQYIDLLETKSSLVGRRDPKWILDRLLSLSVSHRGKWNSEDAPRNIPTA